MFAQRIIDNCNGSVHFLTQEFEKEGFIRQKPGSDMSDYLSDLKNFALNLLKERRSHIMLTESMKATAEKERYERTKFLTEYVDRVKEVNEENEKLRKLHKEKDDEYSHLTSKINDLEVKMTETSRQAQLSTERFTVNNAELSHAREYINLCLAIVNPLSQKCRNLQNLVCAYKYGSKELSKLSSEFSSHKTNLVPASKKTKRSLKSKV